ncbi:MAG: hypothetical protein U0269_30805 [Polyangiales bacterium]
MRIATQLTGAGLLSVFLGCSQPPVRPADWTIPDAATNELEASVQAIELGGLSLGYHDPMSIPVFRSRVLGRFLYPSYAVLNGSEVRGQVHYPAQPGCSIQNTYGGQYPSFAGFPGLQRVTVELNGQTFGEASLPRSGPIPLDMLGDESRRLQYPWIPAQSQLRLSIVDSSGESTMVDVVTPERIPVQITPQARTEPNWFSPSVTLQFVWPSTTAADPRRLRIRLVSRNGAPPVVPGSGLGQFDESILECLVGPEGSLAVRLADYRAWMWPTPMNRVWLSVDTVTEQVVRVGTQSFAVRVASTNTLEEFVGTWR